MTINRIAVSLSKKDYVFLGYIQQGLYYAGKPLQDLPPISDILKATVIHAGLTILSDWNAHGKKKLSDFLTAVKADASGLPSTQRELLDELRQSMNKEALEILLMSHNPDFDAHSYIPQGKMGKDDKNSILGEQLIDETGMSNFILSLDDQELVFFQLVRRIIDTYRKPLKTETSLSEMFRVFFRETFINMEKDDDLKHIERLTLLSEFYVNGLYDMNPVESVLILHGITEYPPFSISKNNLEKLKRIYTDKTLFDIYCEDLNKVVNSEQKNVVKNHSFKRKTSPEGSNLHLDNINLNNQLSEKYRSANSSTSFHSAFLGYGLLFSEWFLDQHNFSLLAYYPLGRTVNGDFLLIESEYSIIMKWFRESFNTLFKKSEYYKDHPGKLLIE